MKLIRSLILLLAAVLLINSCTEGPTEPEIEPGRRDYTWTVDTLDMPMNLIAAIWGSSPTDVWAVGGGGDNEDRLHHYNGNEWKPYTKESIVITGQALFGFSQSNVWMGGGDGRIWHYDGVKWSENYRYIIEGTNYVYISDIWGPKPDDLYACGVIDYLVNGVDNWRGFVLHYDGSSWKEVVRANFNSQFISIRKEQNEIYIFAFRTSTTVSDTVAFYKLNGNELKEIYSDPNKYMGSIRVLNSKIYFSIDEDIYRYVNGNFIKQFSFTHQNFGYQFYGRNVKDIFVRMRDGLAHYNGIDLQYLYNFPLNMVSIMNEPAIFEKEVFFALWEARYARNMVLHGKLKE
jgi:hypothetical protein